MIGTLKLNVNIIGHGLNPKLLASVFNNLPDDAVIDRVEYFKNNYGDFLELCIRSEFFTSNGEIVAKFQRDISQSEDRSAPVTHDHFTGLDFSKVTKWI